MSRSRRDDVATVAADVHERVEASGMVAREDDRDRARECREPVALLTHLGCVARVLPGATEDGVLLAAEYGLVRIPVGGQSRAVGKGLAQLLGVVDHGVSQPAYGAIPRLKSPPA